ncbi:MAG: RagB/SusD family nutrient uptake outer membrane protein [Chitinophagaceae bacterium]|nr:RagB/SusD family nutrient uptake outer membrane protein [Chitinophagaceae bacterium]
MKKLQTKYLLIAFATVLLLGACKKSFVDITPKGQFLSENYYSDATQAYGGLVGVYDAVRKNSGGFENMITMMNAGSDDQLAGGGGATDGAGIQGFSNYTLSSLIIPGSFWSDHYQGIFRANTLLAKLPNTTMDATLKARFVAESKALRALYYFNLVRMFKNIPLLLEPLTATNMYQAKQVDPTLVYAQIEKDLVDAVGVLPSTVSVTTEAGRFTKGAAQALLGKVYLYEKKNTLAAAQFADVNGATPGGVSIYGYKLLSNFSDLWVVANKFNTESILEVGHSSAGNSDWGFWGSGRDEGNTVNVMVGPRSYSRPVGSTAPALPSGWSFNVFTQDFYDAIKTDPRFAATVFDLKALKAAGQADYIEGYQNTGYFLNKFLPRQSDVRTGGGAQELNFKQDSYIIRLADTYLMEAEALGATGARAQALLDAVRARVGLPSIPVTLDAIKQERRLELAGEGHRFFDLVRWGDATTKLASRGFKSGTHEIFPIPFAELQGTLLVQNPNYQ